MFYKVPKLCFNFGLKIFMDNAKYSPLSPVPSVCCCYLKYNSNSCENIVILLLLFQTTWELDVFKKQLPYSSHGSQHVQCKMEVSGLAVCKPGLSIFCVMASHITNLTVVMNATERSPLQLLKMIPAGLSSKLGS